MKYTTQVFNLNESHIGLRADFRYYSDELEKTVKITGVLNHVPSLSEDDNIDPTDVSNFRIGLSFETNKQYNNYKDAEPYELEDGLFRIDDICSKINLYYDNHCPSQQIHFDLDKMKKFLVEQSKKYKDYFYIVKMNVPAIERHFNKWYELVTDRFMANSQKDYTIICSTDNFTRIEGLGDIFETKYFDHGYFTKALRKLTDLQIKNLFPKHPALLRPDMHRLKYIHDNNLESLINFFEKTGKNPKI